MRPAFVALLLALLGLGTQQVHAACGAEPGPCTVPTGSYHLQLPDGPLRGAILYLHGAGNSGEKALEPRDWNRTALARGYALVAPDGTVRPGGKWRGWSFMANRPALRDDHAFLVSVRDDAARRIGIDPRGMILAGFSVGGSMTSYVACHEPQAFAWYAPVAGGFWRPHPDHCDGPVRLLHTHGWVDTTVPLEGRVLRGRDSDDPDAIMQGDIHDTLEMWRQVNGCRQLRADRFVTDGAFLRRAWDRCLPGTALEFALHKGGHVVPDGWAAMMLDWVEAQQAAPTEE